MKLSIATVLLYFFIQFSAGKFLKKASKKTSSGSKQIVYSSSPEVTYTRSYAPETYKKAPSYPAPKSIQYKKVPRVECNFEDDPKSNSTTDRICTMTTTPKCVIVQEQVVSESFEQFCEDVQASPVETEKEITITIKEEAITITATETETVCVEYTDTSCRTVVEPKVETVEVKECQNTCTEECTEKTSTKCSSVEREETINKIYDQCEMVMDEVCSDSPGGADEQCTTEHTRECETVHYTEVCKDVPREVCVTPRNCQQVERKQCKKVSVQEAVPVAECSCEDVSETECTSSPVEVCSLVEKQVELLVMREECADEIKTVCEDRDVPADSLIHSDPVVVQPLCTDKMNILKVETVDREVCADVDVEICVDIETTVEEEGQKKVCKTTEQ